MKRYLILLILFAVIASSGFGQGTDAVVTGTVTDPSSAPVAGAVVTMQNVRTGVANTTRTNDAGVYLFAALPSGVYRLSAEREGFQKYVNDNITLEVGSKLSINVPLELGSTSQAIVVTSTAEQLETNTSTVGTVIATRELLDLPLVGRNAYDLIATQAGTSGTNNQNFNGARSGALNITLDGVVARNLYINNLVSTSLVQTVSVDRVQEFRIVTSPADAEYGRGSGQIQAVSRGGTNQFHGSLFEEHRDTSLTANTWFNNQRGTDPTTGQPLSPRNFLIRNQYGGRIGGPIRRNRTFFNVNYEASRQVARNANTSTVYTETARQGLYRYFPGVRNANALGAVPTVDLAGNPLRPASATGNLQTVSLYGRDPNRMTADPSGIVAKELALMPLPNNFQAGDGLNTAGYTYQQRMPATLDSGDIRIDHIFTDQHRLSFSYSRQEQDYVNISGIENFPTVPDQENLYSTRIYSLSLTSTLRSDLLNEFRAGVFRPRSIVLSPWTRGTDVLPTNANNQPFLTHFTMVTDPIVWNNYGITDDQSRMVPIYQFGDNLTWLRGRHSFKGGFEFRFASYGGYDTFTVVPRVTLGATTIPVQNVNATTIAGLGTNQAGAQQMLAELSGTVSQAFQALNSPGGPNPAYVPGLSRYRHLRTPEFTWFFKDDWKLASNLTLNLGVRYERYGVPVETNGLGVAPVGGGGSMFGISGNSMAALFQPGLAQGSLEQFQAIGPHTANPDTQYYHSNNLNFAPAVGLSWALPGNNRIFGKGKTVLRAGYGISYEPTPFMLTLNTVFGTGFTNTPVYVPSTLTTVSNVPLPLSPSAAPLATVPLTDRSAPSYGYDSNLRTPYYQNWNFSIARSLAKDLVLEARYVGNKGTRMIRAVDVNEVNIFENGILDAFKVTQAGGNAPLFDKIFMGIGGVNGTTMTGSDYLRGNATTQAFLANNNVGALASFLNVNTLAGPPGALLRRAGLPENFVVVNPQYGGQAFYISNFSNSDYHALQLDLTRRFSSGFTLQGNYVWSKALGDDEGDESGMRADFRTLRDRNLDKRVLNFSRAHVFHLSSIWELPFGPGKAFGRNLHGVPARIVAGWQVGAICTIMSGQPISFQAVNAYNYTGGVTGSGNDPSTPMAAAPLSNAGQVTRVGNGVIYFPGLQQVRDPYVSTIGAAGARSQSPMQAIANAAGQLLLVNPAPGELGSIGPNSITGPGLFRLDMNLMRRFHIAEHKEFILRADAVNFTNTPEFANPVTDINNINFGRVLGVLPGSNRVIVVGARVNF